MNPRRRAAALKVLDRLRCEGAWPWRRRHGVTIEARRCHGRQRWLVLVIGQPFRLCQRCKDCHEEAEPRDTQVLGKLSDAGLLLVPILEQAKRAIVAGASQAYVTPR